MINKNEIDLENVIGDEIRKRMKKYMGKVDKIQSSIEEYLTEINDKMKFSYMPVVRVEEEGPFITINFFDNHANRLETLGDMLYFMEVGSEDEV